VALMLPACTTVSSELKTEIQNGAAIGDGELADWGKLTDDQKKEDVFKLTRILHDADFSLWGTPIPDQFASPTSTSTNK